MSPLEQVISILEEIAYLEPNQFKSRAYLTAIGSLKGKGEESFIRRNHYKDIPGIGSSIEKKLLEFKETGTIEKLHKLRKQFPGKLNEKYFKIREHYITKRIPLTEALDLYQDLKKIIGVKDEDITLCGSARRRAELVGDLDVVINNAKPMFLSTLKSKLQSVGYKVASGGDKKLQFIIDPINNLPVDVYVTNDKSYYYMILYLTGSANFDRKIRGIARSKGLKLNQYGLFNKDGMSFEVNSEREIFSLLGINYLDPTYR